MSHRDPAQTHTATSLKRPRQLKSPFSRPHRRGRFALNRGGVKRSANFGSVSFSARSARPRRARRRGGAEARADDRRLHAARRGLRPAKRPARPPLTPLAIRTSTGSTDPRAFVSCARSVCLKTSAATIPAGAAPERSTREVPRRLAAPRSTSSGVRVPPDWPHVAFVRFGTV